MIVLSVKQRWCLVPQSQRFSKTPDTSSRDQNMLIKEPAGTNCTPVKGTHSVWYLHSVSVQTTGGISVAELLMGLHGVCATDTVCERQFLLSKPVFRRQLLSRYPQTKGWWHGFIVSHKAVRRTTQEPPLTADKWITGLTRAPRCYLDVMTQLQTNQELKCCSVQFPKTSERCIKCDYNRNTNDFNPKIWLKAGKCQHIRF